MPLRTLVKVGSITNLSDARYCAGMGVDMLGFRVIEGQDSHISPSRFQEIRGWVTGPLVVAEVYGIKNTGDLGGIIAEYKPDYLEMGLAEFHLFSTFPLPVILFLDAEESMPDYSVKPIYLLTSRPNPLFLPFDMLISIDNAADLTPVLDDPAVKGIALKGSHEMKPGLKDYAGLSEILEHLESD